MEQKIKLKGYKETDFEKPKTFREEILERVARMEESLKNHTGKHTGQLIIEGAILAGIITKIFMG